MLKLDQWKVISVIVACAMLSLDGVLTYFGTIYSEVRMTTADGQGNFRDLFKHEPSPFAEMICPLGTVCCACALEAIRRARLKNVEEYEKSK